jgi:hypothetical protein
LPVWGSIVVVRPAGASERAFAWRSARAVVRIRPRVAVSSLPTFSNGLTFSMNRTSGHRALVEDGLADLGLCARLVLEAPNGLVQVELVVEQVRPEHRDRGVDDLGTALEQLDDRGVEADGHGTRHLDDEGGPRWRAAPGLAGPVAMPRAVEPEVGPQLEATVELDEQVLACGVNGVDLLPDDERDLRPGQAGAGARHDPAGEVRPERDGDSSERVSFRHQAIIAPARSLRRTSPR